MKKTDKHPMLVIHHFQHFQHFQCPALWPKQMAWLCPLTLSNHEQKHGGLPLRPCPKCWTKPDETPMWSKILPRLGFLLWCFLSSPPLLPRRPFFLSCGGNHVPARTATTWHGRRLGIATPTHLSFPLPQCQQCPPCWRHWTTDPTHLRMRRCTTKSTNHRLDPSRRLLP